MAKMQITVEGDDKDELVANMQAALEMLGAEAAEGGSDDDLMGGGDEGGDEEEGVDYEALREKLKGVVTKLAKTAEGTETAKKALKAIKRAKLGEVEDEELEKFEAALKKLKVKVPA